MTISMYAASVPLLQRQLGALSTCLGKAEQHCEAKKIDPQALLQARLYPDMFHLTRQVQVAADMAKTCVARLAGAEPPKYEDNEASFADLRGRIGRTLDYVNGVSPAQIDGSEERKITLPMRTSTMEFKGVDFLRGFILPNFYFHATTAYAILRHNGVELGKRDFLGAA